MLSSTYVSSSSWNSTYFKNPKFDQLLVDARGEADETRRREMYFEAQRLLYADPEAPGLGSHVGLVHRFRLRSLDLEEGPWGPEEQDAAQHGEVEDVGRPLLLEELPDDIR